MWPPPPTHTHLKGYSVLNGCSPQCRSQSCESVPLFSISVCGRRITSEAEKIKSMEEDELLALQIHEQLNGAPLRDSKSPSRATCSQLSGTIECPSCRTANNIPSKKADVYLCGACSKQLKDNKSKIDPKPEPEVESEGTLQLQVQCGQCAAVNEIAVPVGAGSIQFKCGVCESINEAEVT